MHQIWFDFAARRTRPAAARSSYISTSPARAAEGERAAILGRPIFSGLQVGGEGLFLQFATVNVLNEADEKLLHFLEGDAFTTGLQLLTTAQPAIAPLSAMALGLTEIIASRNQNVPVQAVGAGTGAFGGLAPRPRLAEGSYIAVQIPETMRTVWDWQD